MEPILIPPVPAPRTAFAGGLTINWLTFESLLQYNDWLQKQSLSRHNAGRWLRIKSSVPYGVLTWFGRHTTVAELEAHSEYQAPDLAKKVAEEVKKKLQPLLNRYAEANMEMKKMRYNALGLGVFSFDRASIGLMRMRRAGVDPIDVTTRRLQMELGQASTANDLTQVVTSVKDVYAYFPQAEQPNRALRLVLRAGGRAGLTANEMLYTGIAAAAIANFLTENKFGVQIVLMIGTISEKVICTNIIQIKRYEDVLDTNLLLLLSSDPMFYRYKGFHGIIAIYNKFNRSIPENLGYGFDPQLEMVAEATESKDETSIVIRACYSESAVLYEVERIVELVKAGTFTQKS